MTLKGSVSEFMAKGAHPRAAKLITSASLNEKAVQQVQDNQYELRKWKGMCFLGNLLCVGAGSRGIITLTLNQIPQIYQYQEIKKGTPARAIEVEGNCLDIVKVGPHRLCALVQDGGYTSILLFEESEGKLELLQSYPINTTETNFTSFASTSW